jgi:hypothetical protein
VNNRDPGLPDLDGSDFHLALAEAMLGRRPSSAALAAMETESGPVIHQAVWRSGQPDALPLPGDGRSLGLATQRSDGTWRIEPLGERLWEALSLAPKELITRTAPREELDAARDCVRPHFRSTGFDCSDLVAATEVPNHCFHYRQTFGVRWWDGRSRNGSQPAVGTSPRGRFAPPKCGRPFWLG